MKTYGGVNDDFVSSTALTNDGGYIISGSTESFGTGTVDIYLIKTDSVGDTLWTKTYGGDSSDYGSSIEQTNDGGYIIAGSTNSFGAGLNDVYLIKTDANGDTLWTKTFGGNDHDGGSSVCQTSDGGYIILGSTFSFGAGEGDVYLIKTDANGDTIWTKTFGGNNPDAGCSVEQTNDGGYIAAGYTYSFGLGGSDVYLIKTDANGLVGIDENTPTKNNGISIYPNPTSGKINIMVPQNFGEIKMIEIYNCIGQLQEIPENFTDIDISAYKSGLYFLVLSNGKGEKLRTKVLKE
jgi:hypothetical protein